MLKISQDQAEYMKKNMKDRFKYKLINHIKKELVFDGCKEDNIDILVPDLIEDIKSHGVLVELDIANYVQVIINHFVEYKTDCVPSWVENILSNESIVGGVKVFQILTKFDKLKSL